MKQANHTWLDAVKYARQNLTDADLEEMAALADSEGDSDALRDELEEMRAECIAIGEERDLLEDELNGLVDFLKDCFARITSFAPYQESMDEIKAAILADIDQRSV